MSRPIAIVCAALLVGSGHAPAQITLPGDEVRVVPYPLLESVDQAHAAAISKLYERLAAEPIGDELTAGELIHRLSGQHRVRNVIALHVDDLGGPRRLSDDLVEVRVEVEASVLRDELLAMVDADPRAAGMTQADLAALTTLWRFRVFTATGTNAKASLPLPTRQPATTQAAHLSLRMTSDPATDGAFEHSPGTLVNQLVPSAVPAVPPSWVGHLQQSTVLAPAAGGPLRTARIAERDARADLLDRLRGLPFTDEPGSRILGEDPRLAERVADLASQARVTKIDYRGDGSVEVTLTLDGREVWEATLISHW